MAIDTLIGNKKVIIIFIIIVIIKVFRLGTMWACWEVGAGLTTTPIDLPIGLWVLVGGRPGSTPNMGPLVVNIIDIGLDYHNLMI